jgi:hypothetical protein
VPTAVGVALIVAGFLCGVTWVGALSPLGYTRFSLLSSGQTISVRAGGTYLVFQEFPGASAPRRPPPLQVTVTAEGGDVVEVTALGVPGQDSDAATYELGPFEGQAFASVDLPGAGDYLVRVALLDPASLRSADYSFEPTAQLAMGRALSTTWLGSPWVLLAAGVVPIATGAVVLIVAAVRRGRDRASPASRLAAGNGGFDPVR